MAASSINYTGRTLNDETTTTLVAHHEALWMGFTVAQIKAKFYLDYLFITDDGASGFIGGCHIGSPNYEMHNSARIGTYFIHAELTPGVWADFKLYLDAGLNTKGYTANPTIESAEVGNITIGETVFKSAYFANSSDYGFEYLQGGYWYTFVSFGMLAAQTANSPNHVANSVPGFQAGDTVPIRSYIKNSEGDKYSDIVYLALEAAPLTLKYNSAYASYAYIQDITRDIYVGSLPITIGSRFYINAGLDSSPQVDSGYYIFDGKWYYLGIDPTDSNYKSVLEFGIVGRPNWPSGDPGNIYPDPTLFSGKKFYDADFYSSEYDYCIVGNNSNDKLYYNPDDGKVYGGYTEYNNSFNTLFSGCFIVNGTCQGREYLSGDFVRFLTI